MSQPEASSVDCYDYPQYWDLAFGEDTKQEADFVQAAAARYCDFPVTRLLEPGCGGGRLVSELSGRGFDVTGWDLSQTAVDFANQRLAQAKTTGRVFLADMRTAQAGSVCDLGYCFVNTFRHLLTEQHAVQHLRNMAGNIRSGGLYLIGLHLFPPDADEEDGEEWTWVEDGITVRIQLRVADCSRSARLETLRFFMTVTDPAVAEIQHFQTDYRMRLYSAGQMKSLLDSVPEWELVDVFDFWFDLNEPLELTDELGDTVLVLRRR